MSEADWVLDPWEGTERTSLEAENRALLFRAFNHFDAPLYALRPVWSDGIDAVSDQLVEFDGAVLVSAPGPLEEANAERIFTILRKLFPNRMPAIVEKPVNLYTLDLLLPERRDEAGESGDRGNSGSDRPADASLERSASMDGVEATASA